MKPSKSNETGGSSSSFKERESKRRGRSKGGTPIPLFVLVQGVNKSAPDEDLIVIVEMRFQGSSEGIIS